ncbi:MAG: DUF3592 domain-containing protein [Bacteroidales bacterium]|nr:DUF3592 domain-containing protein [Bacteroidales bacterium]MBK7627152.1 DUF3592 domain-containing protein [Bacteroidales bacterium]
MNTGNKILLVICGITLAAGVIIYLEASAYQKTAKLTVGTVVNSGMSRYEIKYTSDDGIERNSQRTQSSKGRKYHDGDKVKVFYQVTDPDKCRITDGKRGGKKVVFWGFILLLFNLTMIYLNRKKETTEKYFKTTGRKVEAQILKIDFDMEINIRNKNPYLIHCKWTDPMTGKEYRHTIRYIWQDPETLLAGRKTIDVYIDRNDPEKYFMDIAFLGDTAK